MLEIQQLYECEISNALIQGGLLIFAPQAGVQAVIFSQIRSKYQKPYRVEYLMNLVTQDFSLYPDILVWIEHEQDALFLIGCKWETGFSICSTKTPLSQELFRIFTGQSSPSEFSTNPIQKHFSLS
jgi:hypothetical protein